MDREKSKNKIVIISLAAVLLILVVLNVFVYYQDGIKKAIINILPLASVIQPTYPQAKLYRVAGDSQVWMVKKGARRQVPNATIFSDLGFEWKDVLNIAAVDLEKIPRIKFIQSRVDDKIYYLTETGYKFLYLDLEILQSYGYSENDVGKIRGAEVSAYPETYLIRQSGDFQVYKIENSRKRPINSPEVFGQMYNWDMVVEINEVHAEKYSQGDEITAALWAEKLDLQVLDNQTIYFDLPFYSSLEISIADSSGHDYFTKKYIFPVKSEQLTFQVGGHLGWHSVSLKINNQMIAPMANFEVRAETKIITDNEKLNGFYPQVRQWLDNDISYCNGVKGYRSPDTWPIWLRDHTYQSKGFRYWEEEMTGILDWFLDNQKSDGSFLDYCPGVRIDVEADLEYLMVQAVYGAWQATGDDEWMFSTLDKLDSGLRYTLNSGFRWDPEHQLVKRPFTCDTWDFHWGSGAKRIDGASKFGILSNDNSGFYQAAIMLSKMYAEKKDFTKQMNWQVVADYLLIKSNQYLWDDDLGYYINFLHLDEPEPAVDVDESLILSLSNVYNINRSNFASHEQAVSVISEYKKRSNLAVWQGKPYINEWFSVYPDYGDDKWGVPSASQSGQYVNGGIMPFVGGELAKASFEHGFEEYGFKQIEKYMDLTDNGKAYLWYWPDGEPGISGNQTLSTDGWGSSAFLSALIEGLVGVKDLSKKFIVVSVSPRWPAAGISEAEATVKYGASDGYLAYQWKHNPLDKTITLVYTGSGEVVLWHILMPLEASPKSVLIDDTAIMFDQNRVEKSLYIDFETLVDSIHQIKIVYE